jgi:cytochrome c biogenesis protein ResB
MIQPEEKSGVASLAEIERARLRQEPVSELFSRLSSDLTLLVRQEIELAKHETAAKLNVLKAEAVAVSLGGVFLHVGLLVLVAAGILALAQVLPAWASALIVGGALAIAGGVLLAQAKARLAKLDLAPQATLQNVERDVDAVKEAVR